MPPGRRSISAFVVQPSRRPNQRSTSSRLVHASKTRCRGALNSLVMTISRSPRATRFSNAALLTPTTFRLPALHLLQQIVELHQRLLPEFAVFACPHGDLPDGGGLEPAWPPFPVACPRHQPRVLEDLQVPRH